MQHFEPCVIIFSTLEIRQWRHKKLNENMFKITKLWRGRGRIWLQAAMPLMARAAPKWKSCSLSAHVWVTQETGLWAGHRLRKQPNHLACGFPLGPILSCKDSYYAKVFLVWIPCLRWFMNLGNCVPIVFMCLCVLFRMVSCALSEGPPLLSLAPS